MSVGVINGTVIGASAAGSVTIGAGSAWSLTHQLSVGGAANGQLTISAGGNLTTDSDISGSTFRFDGIGFSGGAGSVLVTGAGSKWTSSDGEALGVGASGTLTIASGGKVQQTQAADNGGFFLAGGTMSVDGSSIAEAVSNTYPTGTMDLIYWKASGTPGDYAVEFQPLTTTYATGPTTGPSTVLTGGPIQLDAAVSQPLAWNLDQQLHGECRRDEDLLGYSTLATATTENIFLQGDFNIGVASAPTLAATIANGTWWGDSYKLEFGEFLLRSIIRATGAFRGWVLLQILQSCQRRIGRPNCLSF